MNTRRFCGVFDTKSGDAGMLITMAHLAVKAGVAALMLAGRLLVSGS